jgi:hypothetical protein
VTRKPTKRQQDYWDQVLQDHRLGMGRGTTSKLEYWGDSKDLDVQSQRVTDKSGRRKPKRQSE